MATLANFPIVSQRTTITSDGRASENAGYDCVPGSIGACILWYEHKSQWDTSINPDLLKDMAYGEAYRNDGTAAIKYIPICQKLGYNLYSIDGNNAELVQKAHQLIQSNQPVIYTEPDPYSSNPGDSHVCVWFGEGSGTLTALDPYIAQKITRTDSQWQSMLLFGQIWSMVPLHPTQPSSQQGDLQLLQLTDPMGHFFIQKDASIWHCIKTNVDLAYAHLDYYRKHEGIFGLPRTNEIRLASMPETAIVVYERAIACYDPSKKYDNPPGAEQVYLMHTDNGGIGQQIIAKPLIAELQNKVDELNKQIIGLNAELAQSKDNTALDAAHAQLASYQAAIQQVDSLLHPLASA